MEKDSGRDGGGFGSDWREVERGKQRLIVFGEFSLMALFILRVGGMRRVLQEGTVIEEMRDGAD